MEAILCTVDLSPNTTQVAGWAKLFSRQLRLPLVLFHAIHSPSDPIHPTTEFERGGGLSHHRNQSMAAAQNVMKTVDWPWQMETAFGEPVEMIQQYCRTHPVAMVVTGRRAMAGIKRYLLGTVVERLARMLPCPMLVVHPDKALPPGIKTIGVCTDTRETNRPLVEQAVALCLAFDAELHFFSNLESATTLSLGIPDERSYGAAQQELKSRWRDALETLIPMEKRLGLKFRMHLSFGEALDEIPAQINSQSPDLLIVGVRTRSLLGQWMTGSTTEAVLRKVRCAVLAVPLGMFQDHGVKRRLAGDVDTKPPTGIVIDHVFLSHRSAETHLENHQRLEIIFAMLERADGSMALARIASRAATLEELTLVHDLRYVLQIAATARQDYSQLTPDTYACRSSFRAATRAVGAVLNALDAVMVGKVRHAFVPVRPPGHHAEASRAYGFCLFNNVAIAAAYARQFKGVQKVLIVDWDLHHGNGIQHIFEADPSVLYISSHQYPCFPGTGHYLEIGRGPGEGYTINLPLKKGWGDGDYIALFQKVVAPIAMAFHPDFVLGAVGFDIHRKDPVGRMRVTEAGFAGLTRILMNIASQCCQGRLILVLEGGYHLNAIGSSSWAVLGELGDLTHADLHSLAARAKSRRVGPVVKRCAHVFKHVWPCLSAIAS